MRCADPTSRPTNTTITREVAPTSRRCRLVIRFSTGFTRPRTEATEAAEQDQHGGTEARKAERPVASALRAGDGPCEHKHKRLSYFRPPFVFVLARSIAHAGRRPGRDRSGAVTPRSSPRVSVSQTSGNLLL